MTGCERHEVGYLVGINHNQRITPLSRRRDPAERPFVAMGEKQMSEVEVETENTDILASL